MNNPHDVSYYRQRTRNRAWEAVVTALDRAHDINSTKRKDIADYLGVPPSQISRWLSGPSNWTLDTITDLLLAAGCEMDFQPVRFDERARKNEFHELNAPSQNRMFEARSDSAGEARIVVKKDVPHDFVVEAGAV
jgi:hypothetical protein